MLPETRRKVLVEYNGRRVDLPSDTTVLRLIEVQADRTPHATAYRWGRISADYRELMERSCALSERFRDLGVGHGSLLPLVTEGGPGALVAMIAAMRLGAVFVPFDSQWPAHRIGSMMSLLRPPLVARTGPSGPWAAGLPTLLVDHADTARPPAAPVGRTPARVTADDLVYGFFTSGSTGEPKCALNIHRGLVNRFLYMTRRFGSGREVVLQNSHHVFDSSIWQLLWPLTKGGEVVLPRRRGILDLESTIGEVERHRVTMTDFVPSVFNVLVEMLETDSSLVPRLASLRHLLIGGEEINPGAVWRFRKLLPGVRVTNTFGPTEASIGSVFHEVTDEDRESVPIGRPIDNTYVALLDDAGNPVEPGRRGEIYLGGDCLGSGYLGDAEQTARAFVPNHLPEIPGDRLYRTGDLAYHRPDGLLMFAGRRDHQIKLGGVRIEPVEVETAVETHPAVREVRVVLHRAGGTPVLVCCVVTGAPVSPQELAECAGRLLPPSCLPGRYVFLDRMPLTGNGKTDRAALARIVADRGLPGEGGGALGAMERMVQEAWEAVLGCADPPVTADFHACGGSSLSLQRLALFLRDRLGSEVSVRVLADSPTIREQAAALEDRGCDRRQARLTNLVERDLELPPDLAVPARSSPGGPPRRVLLTGATGFVGAQVLAELLARTDAAVDCLVRDLPGAPAQDRIAALLRDSDRGAPSRVAAVRGDLSLPRLGLDSRRYAELGESVDAVVHCGAVVNLLLGYRGMRGVNVDGTREIMRLASRGRLKHVHLVSTLSVFPESASSRIAEEAEPWDELPLTGYGKSKWAAEKVAPRFREAGVPSTVYRLGEVMAHTRTGRANPASLLDLLLRACLRLGMRFPTPAVTDWTPVDVVGRFLVGSLDSPHAHGTAFHLLCPGRVGIQDLMEGLASKTGLREVPYSEFWNAVQRRSAGGDGELGGLASVLPDPAAVEGAECLRSVFSDAGERFSSENARRFARGRGIGWSAASGQETGNYLGALLDSSPSLRAG